MPKNVEAITLGWSPHGDERKFVVSPSHFCSIHKLNPCQCGVVLYLSRYQFEKNPWLIEQSILLINLMLTYGKNRLPWYWRLLTRLGQPVYLAPRLRDHSLDALSVITYCALNGISNRLMLPINLICSSPTENNLQKAVELLQKL
ncbi:MAG: hypothetical protein RLN96_00240 [Pseudomonadales bacterium]